MEREPGRGGGTEPKTIRVYGVMFRRVNANLYSQPELGLEIHGNYTDKRFCVCRVQGETREWLQRLAGGRVPPDAATTGWARAETVNVFRGRAPAAKAALRKWYGGRAVSKKESASPPVADLAGAEGLRLGE